MFVGDRLGIHRILYEHGIKAFPNTSESATLIYQNELLCAIRFPHLRDFWFWI